MRSEVLCFHVFPQSTGYLKIDPKHMYADVTALVGFKEGDVGLTPTGPFDHWKTLIVNIDNDTLKTERGTTKFCHNFESATQLNRPSIHSVAGKLCCAHSILVNIFHFQIYAKRLKITNIVSMQHAGSDIIFER